MLHGAWRSPHSISADSATSCSSGNSQVEETPNQVATSQRTTWPQENLKAYFRTIAGNRWRSMESGRSVLEMSALATATVLLLPRHSCISPQAQIMVLQGCSVI